MKAQLGMPTGLALALLSTLLVALFAVGAFSVAQAQTPPSADRSFSADTVAPGTEITVTIEVSNVGRGGAVEETLPPGFEYVDGSGGALATLTGDVVGIAFRGTVSSVSYKVIASSTAGVHTFNGTLEGETATVVIGGDSDVTVQAATTNGGNGGEADESPIHELSTDVASAGVRIELDAVAGKEVPAGEDLMVTLKSWGLPSSIPESSVLILGESGDDTEPYSGEPAEVRIESGNKILLALTSRYVNGNAAGPLLAGQPYRIVFKKSAGITNPAVAGGRYAIKVDDLDDDTHTSSGIQIKSKITLKPSSGPRGTQVEVSAVGLQGGDATFYLKRQNYASGTSSPSQEDGTHVYTGDGYRLDKSSASGGKSTVTIDTTTQNFVAGTRLNDKRDTLQGLNVISVVDGAGKTVNIPARFEITPLMELDGDTFKRGGKVDITVSDWDLRHPPRYQDRRRSGNRNSQGQRHHPLEARNRCRHRRVRVQLHSSQQRPSWRAGTEAHGLDQ